MTLLGIWPSSGATQGRWTIADTPTVSIGGDATGPASDLYGITGLVRLSDGRIVVGDRAQRVIVFDAAGRHVRTFGARGEGPGEFSALRSIQRLAGDTLLVSDARNALRLSYFTADGAFIRSVNAASLGGGQGFGAVVGALADGTLVGLRSGLGGSLARGPDGEVQWGRGEIQLLRFGSDGRALGSLGTYPGYEEILIPGLGPMAISDESSPMRATLVAVGRDRVYLATGDRFEVRAFTPEGGNAGVISEEYDLVPTTERHLVDFFTVHPAGARFDRTRWESMQWNLERGRSLPAITDLRLDDEGNLWIGEFRAGPAAVQTWHVHSGSGTHVATATMPAGFRAFAIGRESVLGVWRDQVGVEYVQVRTIVKR
jgi:hypothetical protein